MADVRDTLKAAVRERGYTYERLLLESGLDCDLSSLSRKLNGGQGLEAHEARDLARVLGVRVAGIDRMLSIADELGAVASWQADKRRGA